MAVQNATTRKRIATVKLTESELILIGETLAKLAYNEDPGSQSALFKQTQKKIFEAKALFAKYT